MRKCIALLLTLSFPITAFATTSMITKDAELSRVSHQIQQLQKTITLTQQQQQQLEAELQNTEIAIGDLGLQINRLSQSVSQEQQKLTQLKTTQQQTLAQLEKQNIALARQMRAAYQLHSLQPMKVILNQDNPSAVQRHLYYYQRLATLRLQIITRTRETLSRLKTILLSISQNQHDLKLLLAQKQSQQSEQQQAQLHRQQLITTLHQNVMSKQQELTVLLANQQALQDIISRLKTQTIESTLSGKPFNQLRGQLHWPIKGTVMADFGSPLDVGDQHLSGVILKAPQGTPVHAISSGKVIFSAWLRGFGLLIIINHGNNFMSLYGRNHALYAKVGDKVNIGDTIATTGNSGGFDKSSLYFEIRQNGQPINPNLWCR